jgi:hypothetical protein
VQHMLRARMSRAGQGLAVAGPTRARPGLPRQRPGLASAAASWTMDVRVDEITGVRFVRGPYPFPSFPGREVLTVEFLGPDGESSLGCFVHDLYDGQRMRPEKLEAWQALRERYGNRDESRVDRGRLLPPAA